jgi:type I restriction enzyme S subunit
MDDKHFKVPDGWEFISLKRIIAKLDAGVSVNSEERQIFLGEFGILKTSSVTNSKFNPNEHKTIVTKEIKKAKVAPKADHIIISRMNTPELVGASAYVEKSYPYLFLPDRLWQIELASNYKTLSKLLSYILTSKRIRSKISSIATGTSNSMKNISKSALFNIKILLPPLPEQRKIADILSTWDRAVDKMEKLIEAKTTYKKALMQQLLTGKMRFKEFENEKWRESKLKAFFTYFSKKKVHGKDLTILSCTKNQGIIAQADRFSKRIASKDLSRYKVVEKGDLIYDPMLLWDASISFLKNFDRGVISPAYFTFKFNFEKGIKEYFEFFLDSHYMREHYKSISRGTNVRRKKAPHVDFLSIKIIVPSIDEQQKIASALGAADEEIRLLRQQLDAVKNQKKGLMQKLLTGQIRVKP